MTGLVLGKTIGLKGTTRDKTTKDRRRRLL